MKQSLAYLDKIVELINLGAEINIKARLTHLKRIIEDESEQLHKPVVVRGGDSESQLVERTKRYFKYPDWIERKITPPEPLPAEGVAQNGRGGKVVKFEDPIRKKILKQIIDTTKSF